MFPAELLQTTVDVVTGLQRGHYEEEKIDFDSFVSRWHRPQNYFFLMIYLRDKAQDELTGLEAHVKQLIDHRSPLFFPLVSIAEEDGNVNSYLDRCLEIYSYDMLMVCYFYRLTSVCIQSHVSTCKPSCSRVAK